MFASMLGGLAGRGLHCASEQERVSKLRRNILPPPRFQSFRGRRKVGTKMPQPPLLLPPPHHQTRELPDGRGERESH